MSVKQERIESVNVTEYFCHSEPMVQLSSTESRHIQLNPEQALALVSHLLSWYRSTL